MADKAQDNLDRESAAEAGTPSEEALAVAAALAGGVVEQGPEPEAPSTETVNEPLSGNVLVEWPEGGTREVPIEDLVKAAQQRDQSKSAMETAEGMLGKVQEMKALDQTLQSLGIRDRQDFLLKLARGEQPNETIQDGDMDIDDDMEPSANGEQSDDRFAKLERMVVALAKDRQAQEQVTAKSQLRQEVEKALDGFSVFKDERNADWRDHARQNIMRGVALGEVTDLEAEAVSAAAVAQAHPGKSTARVQSQTQPVTREQLGFDASDLTTLTPEQGATFRGNRAVDAAKKLYERPEMHDYWTQS